MNTGIAPTDLPAVVSLSFDFGPSGQRLVADAGAASIGHLSLDLLSDESLLTRSGTPSPLTSTATKP